MQRVTWILVPVAASLIRRPFATLNLVAVSLTMIMAQPPMAVADVIVSNLSLGGGGIRSDTNVAQSFTIGSQAEEIQSVTLDLFSFGQTGTVSLYSQSGGLPGSLLVTLGTITADTTHANKDYTLSALPSFTLQAGTTYWLDFKAPSFGTFWDTSSSFASTGTGTLGDEAINDGSGFFTLANVAVMQVDGSPTPEPSGFALFGMVVTGLGVARWRKRKQPA